VSQLKAGPITVREGTETKNYFVSDGFLFFNSPKDDSGCCTCEISGIELVPASSLDKDRAAQVRTLLSIELVLDKETQSGAQVRIIVNRTG
jgi:hypothetical protein